MDDGTVDPLEQARAGWLRRNRPGRGFNAADVTFMYPQPPEPRVEPPMLNFDPEWPEQPGPADSADDFNDWYHKVDAAGFKHVAWEPCGPECPSWDTVGLSPADAKPVVEHYLQTPHIEVVRCPETVLAPDIASDDYGCQHAFDEEDSPLFDRAGWEQIVKACPIIDDMPGGGWCAGPTDDERRGMTSLSADVGDAPQTPPVTPTPSDVVQPDAEHDSTMPHEHPADTP